MGRQVLVKARAEPKGALPGVVEDHQVGLDLKMVFLAPSACAIFRLLPVDFLPHPATNI